MYKSIVGHFLGRTNPATSSVLIIGRSATACATRYVWRKAVSGVGSVPSHISVHMGSVDTYGHSNAIVVTSIGSAGRIGVTAVPALPADLVCEFKTYDLHNVCLVLLGSAVFLKPSSGPSV